MCFALFAGTTKPLPRKAWRKDSSDLHVQPLTEYDAHVRQHFRIPVVQYVGATSGCGCDFPHVTLFRGEWTQYDFEEEGQAERERRNREALVALLREAGEKTVELYSVWEGDFNEPPMIREEVSLKTILDPAFRFKERGFYTVQCRAS